MYVLDQKEIRKIEYRLALAEINNNSLSIDLIDHICCMIEERLEKGMNLNKAEEEVFKEMGEVQLKAIDLETKLLTQNKIIMKKRTKIIGIVALVLMFSGFALKLIHLPGASIMWVVGALVAVFGFIVFLTIDHYSYIKSSKDRVKSTIGVLGAVSFIIGIVFKVQHWPLSHYFIAIGGFVLLAYFIFSMSQTRNFEEQN